MCQKRYRANQNIMKKSVSAKFIQKKKADKKIKKGEEKEEKKKVCVCVFFILGEFD